MTADTDTNTDTEPVFTNADLESPDNEYQLVGDVLGDFIDRLDATAQGASHKDFIQSGFTDVDNMLGGIRRGEVIIVSGHTDSGKLDFIRNILENVSIKYGLPVSFTGIAQVPHMVMSRVLSSLGYIDNQKLQLGYLEDNDWPRLTSSVSLVDSSPFYFFLPSRFSTADFEKHIISLKKKEPDLAVCGIYTLSYLTTKSSQEYTPESYARMMRDLKAIAHEQEVAIIGAVDMPMKTYEGRTDRRPVHSDLRPNYSLIDFADRLIFLYRDEYYNEDSPHRGLAEVIVAKNVLGPIGTRLLTYRPDFHRFENYIAVPDEQEGEA